MKQKPPHGTRGKSARGKAVKKEVHSVQSPNTLTIGHQYQNARPSVEITKCISYQKFRYSGENRPGKKYQEKDFMDLKLSNLNDRVVRIVIICTDAETRELIHPNGLVGKDCHDGIYDKEYAITKNIQEIKIPYLRTERIKTKKNESDNIQQVLETRASHLPSPYKERCLSQCNDRYTQARKFETTKVCLGVIVTIVSHQGSFNGSLHAVSHVVRNASEKTTLGILKLSQQNISASEGGFIDIFTTEHGPEIEDGKYFVYVTYENDNYGQWRSETTTAGKDDILYKRIIAFHVPPFALCPDLPSSVIATLNLECPQSNQSCSYDFTYKPHNELIMYVGSIQHQNKRSFSGQEDVKSVKRLKTDGDVGLSNTIKENLQNKLRARQDHNNGNMMTHQQGLLSEASHMVSSSGDSTNGETPVYMDLDHHQRQSANAPSIISGSEASVLEGQAVQLITSSSSDSHQAMEVVATGYSDAVPPDTTVLIYTTTRGLTADNLPEAVQEDQVILQEIPSRSNQLSDIHMPSKDVIEYVKDSKKAGIHILTSRENAQVLSSLHNNVSGVQVIDSKAVDNSTKAVQTTEFYGRLASPSTRQLVITSSSPSTTSASDDKVIRRIVVPNKLNQASPWEVGSDDANLAAVLFPSNSKVLKPNNYKEPQAVNDPINVKKMSDKEQSDLKSSLHFVHSNTSFSQNWEKPMAPLNLDSLTLDTNNLSTLYVSEIANDMINLQSSALSNIDEDPKSIPVSKDGTN